MTMTEDQIRDLLHTGAHDLNLQPLSPETVIGEGRRAAHRRNVTRASIAGAVAAAVVGVAAWSAVPRPSAQPRPAGSIATTTFLAAADHGPITVHGDAAPGEGVPPVGDWTVRYGRNQTAIRLVLSSGTTTRTLDWLDADLASGRTTKWLDDHLLVALLPARANGVVDSVDGSINSATSTIELPQIGAQLTMTRYQDTPDKSVAATWMDTTGTVHNSDPSLHSLPITNSAGERATMWWTDRACGEMDSAGHSAGFCDTTGVAGGVYSNRWAGDKGRTTYLVDVTGHGGQLHFAADSTKPDRQVSPRSMHTIGGRTFALFEVPTSTIAAESTVSWLGGSGTVL